MPRKNLWVTPRVRKGVTKKEEEGKDGIRTREETKEGRGRMGAQRRQEGSGIEIWKIKGLGVGASATEGKVGAQEEKTGIKGKRSVLMWMLREEGEKTENSETEVKTGKETRE